MYRIPFVGTEALASKLGLRISGSVGWLVGRTLQPTGYTTDLLARGLWLAA